MAVLLLCGMGSGMSAQAQVPTSRLAQGKIIGRTYQSALDGATVNYALWVPASYTPDRSWPLIVFLHGSAEGRNWDSPTAPEASVPVRGVRNDLQFLVVFPLMRGSVTVTGPAERDVLETIADVGANYKVDADRIHLTGLSFGGFAAWQLACHYPDLFASLTVFCGGGQPDLTVNLRHLPVRVYHGAADNNVPPVHSREMVEAMRAAKIQPAVYKEFPGVGHVCWRETYADPELYEWMAGCKRNAAPARICYRTHSLMFPGAYWARIAAVIDPSKPSFIDVFVPSEGQILIHAENVAGLALRPPASLVKPDSEPAVQVDGKSVKAVRAEDGWWLDLSPLPEGVQIKTPGVSGPIQDVYRDSFALVVPGRGEPAAVATWNEVAAAAIGWTKPLVYKQILAIKDVDMSPIVAATMHLICFGDTQNNAVLAKVRDQLPLYWQDEQLIAGDRKLDGVAAMVMIYPNPLAPRRYLVVCTGKPEAAARLATEVLRPAMLAPAPLEDIVVLMNSGQLMLGGSLRPERPARMGAPPPPRGPLFDTCWQLPSAVRDLMK